MTKTSGNFIKGIAILFMITHHLFWNQGGYGFEIGGVALSQRIGIMGKICVTLFLMLSGYGLCKKYGSNFGYREQKRRLFSLYLVYWICIIFVVIIGLLFFKDKFFGLFAGFSLKDNIKNSVLTVFGLQAFGTYQGIIGAWWFVSLILTCYIAYPFFVNQKKPGNCLSGVVLVLWSCLFYYSQGFTYILAYLLPFFLGVMICKYDILANYRHPYSMMIVSLIFIVARLTIVGLTKWGFALEICISITFLFMFQNIKKNVYSAPILYIGEKSAYIFYIHMIFANYYCSDYIYAIQEPIVMVGVVLALSLLCSIVLEKIELLIRRKIAL